MDLTLSPADMAAAGASVASAASDARGADGADALTTLAAALPGSATASAVDALADLWRDGIGAWSDAVDDVATGVVDTSGDATATDGGLAGLWDRVGGFVGGS